MGLATVYGIVKQNGGFINVYSEMGRGATFNIYLPRSTGNAEGSSDETGAVLHCGRGETVLLVEDESAMLEATQAMLEQLGHRVLAADALRQALCLAEEHLLSINLVMTDMIMPEMNGYDLVEQLHVLTPQIHTILMSGYPASAAAERSGAQQKIHHLPEPFSIKELATKIKMALESV